MRAQSALSDETLAELGISPSADVHSARDADKLGIDLTGPEHDGVDSVDFELELEIDNG